MSLILCLIACLDYAVSEQTEPPTGGTTEPTGTVDTGPTEEPQDSAFEDTGRVDLTETASPDTGSLDTAPPDRSPPEGDRLVVIRSTDEPNRYDVYVSNGDGTFAGPTAVGDDHGETWSGPVVGDFDGDGVYDILARGTDSGTYRLLSGQGDGTFTEREVVGGLPYNVIGAGDLDGDGDLDLFGWPAAGGDGWSSLGHGDGTFTHTEGTWDAAAVHLGYRTRVVRRAGDLDGDGVPDLAAFAYASSGNDTSTGSLFRGLGDGTFAGPIPVPSVPGPVNGLDLADVDCDGDADVVAGLDDDGDPGQVWWLENDGGLYTRALEALDARPMSESGSDDDGYGTLGALDFDGDGCSEVVTMVHTDGMGDPELSLHDNVAGTYAPGSPIAPAALIGEVGSGVAVSIPMSVP